MRLSLRGSLILEQLDVGAVADPEQGDLVDHRGLVDPEQLVHERPLGVADRPERERRCGAHHVLEPRDRLVDVRHGQAHVVHRD